MTSIRNFFPTSSTTPSPGKSEIKSIPISRPDHKLIVTNMKSVINSVKMQKKAKKRKRNRDEPQEIHDISTILKSNLSFISPNRASTAEACEEETPNEVNVIVACSEVKSSDKSVTNDSIETDDVLDNSSKENSSIDVNTTKTCSQSSRIEEKIQSKTNAFEFMMTARNKSIGTNSPGKDILNKPVSPVSGKKEEVINERRLMLEEWAERKGRAKKRLMEAAGDEYIDIVMKKRAKRLRTLIANGNKQKDIESSDEEPIVPLVKRSNGKIITKRRYKIIESDSSNDDDRNDQQKSSASSTSSKELVSSNDKRKNKAAINEDFVEKLSSPIKKRDSLFGYFSKLTKSPTNNITPPVIEDVSLNMSSKKRGRPRKTVSMEEKPEKPSKTDHQRQITPSPTPIHDSPKQLSEGRPKRLCRDKKMSYFIDEDYTPFKLAVKQLKSTHPTKLAPIFAKATPKAVIDPVVLRARHEFLMSGIPEKMKLEMEKQRQFEEFYETEFEMFPKISHVGHHVSSSIAMDLATLNIRFRSESREDAENKFSLNPNKIFEIEKSALKQSSNEIQALVHQKELMKTLKSNDESQFPYFRCFKQLKRKHTTHLTEEGETDLSVELIIDKVASTNGYLTFTEQYKPMTTSEILINSKPLLELKKFLSSWQENEDRRQRSDDDFDISSSSSFSISSFNKAIVLTGPPGCGKTMFVYALANEMNFKVLEINAGAKRTGKRVLKKLQEATQSHHVNNNQCSQNDRLNLLKKTKSKSSQSDDSEDTGGNQKLSLILIEDAEVVFEQDFGFVESINQLITMSKRPVILITNQINCAHLSRFISKNTISFHAPKPTIASKWLSTLSVLEQCYLTVDMCQSFYRRNNCDFRKTLLELQFFIQSGSQTTNSTSDECGNDDKVVACMTHNKLYDLFHKDQNRLDVVLPFPVDFGTLSSKSSEILKSKNKSSDKDSKSIGTNSDPLSNSFEFLNMMSTVQWFDHRIDSSDRVVNHLNDEINHFLVEQSVKNHLKWNSELACAEHTVTRPRLASIISNPNNHSSRSSSVDVEPCLRSICRSEFIRSQTERRSSRFYHYLRNANTNSFGTKVFDQHCSILNSDE